MTSPGPPGGHVIKVNSHSFHRRRSCEGPGIWTLVKIVLRGSTAYWTLVKIWTLMVLTMWFRFKEEFNQSIKSNLYTGWVKKSRPPTSFIDIFAWAQSFCIKFCTFIGNIYPRMCTDFRSYIVTFSEMALILSRAPIIFTVSSLDCSARDDNAEYQLNGNDIIGQWSRLNCRFS